MFALARALAYASIFMGVVLALVPARLLSRSGFVPPAAIGPFQVGGTILLGGGAALALWCVVTFAVVGKGTPVPFDPPRRLVVRGPYRFVRNPMAIGVWAAVAGAALFYRSPVLAGFCVLFALMEHLFVLAYEEPTLRRLFGVEYEAYRKTVPRWIPKPRRPVRVRRAVLEDEPIVRDLRLQALSDAPEALDSTLEEERSWMPSDWQQWLSQRATFILERAGEPKGIAVGVPHRREADIVLLMSMWVHPDLRGTGGSDSLVASVLAWAKAEGAVEIMLHVGKHNHRARRCYERNGFRSTGREVVRERDGIVEIEMRLPLPGEGA